MIMERVNNNEFKKKLVPNKLQYLKDCDDDNVNNFRSMNTKLKAIIWLLSVTFVMVTGYMFDQIFLH